MATSAQFGGAAPCGHGINPHADIVLDEGEHLAAAYGVLGYYYAPEGMM